MRGSRCILGSGNIIKWTVWLMRRRTVNFGSISSHVFAKSSFSLSYSFTLDMHFIGQPRSLSPLLWLGKKDQPSHLTCNLQRRAFPWGWGGGSFPSLMWLLKNPRKKSSHFFCPLPLNRCTISSLQKAWKNKKQKPTVNLQPTGYYVSIFLYFHLFFFYPYIYIKYCYVFVIVIRFSVLFFILWAFFLCL